MVGFFLVASASVVFAQTMATEETTMCTLEYMPVCASVQVQCIKAPCPPINETFGNACSMRANKNATFLYTGECKSGILAWTTWNIQSFDNKVATGADISFENDTLSAHVCNIFNGSYSVEENKFLVGPMISTKMACMGDLATYESAFDLSGATYELSTDGGNHMTITTIAGHTFQWSKENPTWSKPIGMLNPASVYCTDNGWSLNIVDGKDGQYGMCTFSDGSQCEEWTYYRGECKSAQEKIQNVWGSYLAPIHFTAEGYANFVKNLKQKFELQAASVQGSLQSAYNQLVYFFKDL